MFCLFFFFRKEPSEILSANKLICTLNAPCGPAGSYSTILNWVADYSTEVLSVPSLNEVITFLIIVKCLQEIDGFILMQKTILSTITTVIHFFPHVHDYKNFPTCLQDSGFTPRISSFLFSPKRLLFSSFCFLLREYREQLIDELLFSKKFLEMRFHRSYRSDPYWQEKETQDRGFLF